MWLGAASQGHEANGCHDHGKYPPLCHVHRVNYVVDAIEQLKD